MNMPEEGVACPPMLCGGNPHGSLSFFSVLFNERAGGGSRLSAYALWRKPSRIPFVFFRSLLLRDASFQ